MRKLIEVSSLSRVFWMMHAVIVVSSLSLLAGCDFTTTQRVPLTTGAVKADQARVYVYCIKGMGAKPANISDGNTPIGDVFSQGYVCWDHAPGKTVIRAVRAHGKGVYGDLTTDLSLDLIGGQTYYVEVIMYSPDNPIQLIPLVAQGLNTLSLVIRPEQEAIAVINKECKAPEVSAIK